MKGAWQKYCSADKWHSASNLFPLLADQELQELADDISKNGLQNPIVLLDGLVLDGRNRLLACQLAKLEPTLVPWKPNGHVSPIAWVIAQNAKRRHLTPSQKAFVAVEAEKVLAVEAKERQRLSKGRGRKGTEKTLDLKAGEAAAQAARLVGVNVHYVRDAKKIAKEAPQLAADVKTGRINLAQAVRVINENAREARRQENREKIERVTPLTAIEARFATILIDPPWDVNDENDVNLFGRGRPDYTTLPFPKLLGLPVAKLADIDCHLYLWITNRSLPKGFQLIETWGFEYITAITWCKPSFGMGNYFRGSTEHILFARKGSQPLKRKDVGTWFQAPRGKDGHSSKPVEAYELIESCSPGPYLEMFSRSKRKNWTQWGQDGYSAAVQ